MMNKTHVSILLAVTVLLCMAWFAGAQSTDALGPVVVGVVGVETVLNQVDARTQMNADLQSARERVLAEKETRDKLVKDLQQDLEWLPDNSPEHLRKQEELEEATIQRAAWVTYQNNKLAREEKLRYEDLYRQMLAAIQEVSEGSSVDLVLFKEKHFEVPREWNTAQILALAANRKVLYARPGMDLTEQVITRMNVKSTPG